MELKTLFDRIFASINLYHTNIIIQLKVINNLDILHKRHT